MKDERERLTERFAKLSSEELLKIAEDKANYTPLAIEVASLELSSRNGGDYIHAFQALVNSSLSKNGVDDNCNISENEKWSESDEQNHTKLLESLNFNDLFDKVVLTELDSYKKVSSNPSKSEFIANYHPNFHYSKIAEYAPDFVQSRNAKLEKAYNSIVETINRIQGWMDNESVRIKIESNYRNSPNHLSTIYQCTTPFCIISLGCDQIGRYNIVYTIDSRIKEIIGSNPASTLIRRIYEFTPGEMEPFVNIHSLHGNCIGTFKEILELSKTERYHKVTQKERFEGESLDDELRKLLDKVSKDNDLSDEDKERLNWARKY